MYFEINQSYNYISIQINNLWYENLTITFWPSDWDQINRWSQWLLFFANRKSFFFFGDSLVQKTYPVIKYGGEREREKKNHILSFDIYRIVSSSSMICRISHYFPVFGNQKCVKACDLHANTSKRVEIHVFFVLNMQITSRPWYGYVCSIYSMFYLYLQCMKLLYRKKNYTCSIYKR